MATAIMTQVVLPVAKTACKSTPTKIFFSLIMPLNPINPFNWILYLIIVFSIYFSTDNTILNSIDGKRSFTKSLSSGFWIYYIIMFFIYYILLSSSCKVIERIPDLGPATSVKRR